MELEDATTMDETTSNASWSRWATTHGAWRRQWRAEKGARWRTEHTSLPMRVGHLMRR